MIEEFLLAWHLEGIAQFSYQDWIRDLHYE